MGMKSAVKRIIAATGYELRRRSTEPFGQDPFGDMRELARSSDRPVIFDVGANIGQTIDDFRRVFAHPQIHSFEPGQDAFAELQKRTSGIPDLHLNRCALGAQPGTIELIENTSSPMSSILEPSVDCWGSVKQRRQVSVRTLDEYCEANSLSSIDILKSDTQGYDLEVIKGGRQLLEHGRIGMIYLEIILSDMYKGSARLDEIYGFLADHGLSLLAFYKIHYKKQRAGWTDALFINWAYDPK